MKTSNVLQDILKILEMVDHKQSELIFKVNGNKVVLDGIDKLENSNNININLSIIKK